MEKFAKLPSIDEYNIRNKPWKNSKQDNQGWKDKSKRSSRFQWASPTLWTGIITKKTIFQANKDRIV